MVKWYLSAVLMIYSTCAIAQPNIFPSTGSVGIGTTLPQETLHVNGGQMLNGNLTFATDQNAFFIKGPANGGAIRIRSNVSSTFDRNIQFGNIDNNGSWNSYMIVEQNGNVGVGTLFPSSAFHVNGITSFRSNTPTDGYLTINPGGPTTQGYINWWKPGDTRVAYMGYNDGTSFNNLGLTLEGANFIVNGGNVGIGTNSPDSKLAVNGNIRAKEVKVETANWPDYVFAEDYELPTLQETEKHIKEKGHLPDIPSAAEVKANGVDLGEMNAKLLQKIEELTLYIINLEKRVKSIEIKQ